MKPEIITTASNRKLEIWQGDCLESLRAMPDGSVHCCVTSPPYWGLRDYGCDGQIGLEDTPEQFIEKLVAVFREVRRVLRKDGTCWVNMGDGYAGSWGAQSREVAGKLAYNISALSANQARAAQSGNRRGSRERTPSCKPKDLIGQPWMLAFALRADGWHLRQDIIWHKPNPMPESVRDRCTKAHEYIFLLTKSAKYFYDAEAIADPAAASTRARLAQNVGAQAGSERAHAGGKTNGNMKAVGAADTRNKRSVWTVTTRGYAEAHFATFPPKLIEPCIKAGCPEKCCPKCGAPWERETEVSYDNPGNRTTNGPRSVENRHQTAGFKQRLEKRTKTLGFKPTCECGCEPVGGTVLDPFGGSFTTAEVALKLGCDAIMCELNPEYIEMGKRRLKPLIEQARMF